MKNIRKNEDKNKSNKFNKFNKRPPNNNVTYRYFYRTKIGWWKYMKHLRKGIPFLYWGCVGYARSLEDFDKAKMYDDEMMCAPLAKNRKSKEWVQDTRPMLLFTIRHRANKKLIYSFFSKDFHDVNEEVERLNEKHGKDTDTGFYLDDTGFDERWNSSAVSFYKQRNIEYEG